MSDPAAYQHADRDLLERSEDALHSIALSLLGVKPWLDKTYTDMPELTPWTRGIGPQAHRAHDLAMAIRKHLGLPHHWRTTALGTPPLEAADVLAPAEARIAALESALAGVLPGSSRPPTATGPGSPAPTWTGSRPPQTGGPTVTERATPVLYLDIDGTVRQGKDDALGRFVNGPKDVVVFPDAVERMRAWKQGGGRIVGVSNQGGIALGILTLADVGAAMIETQRQCEGLFDKIAWCSHHPQATHPEMARCWCRKPAPGLIIEAALDLAERFGEYYPPHMALMVGDRPEDEQCARTAGLDFQWAADWRAGR